MSVIVKVGDKVRWNDGGVGMVTYVNEGEFEVYWADDDTLINCYSSADIASSDIVIIESEND